MSFSLADGTIVEIDQPEYPSIVLGTPGSVLAVVAAPQVPVVGPTPVPTGTNIITVPVAGPPGPRGPSGVSSDASCVWSVSTPVYLVQVLHGLGFYPAGITAIDTQGHEVEYASVAYPSIDITEVSFDVMFSGTIYLS